MAPRVLTVSATYGAGGSVVAPAVASRLGLVFVDRLFSAREATNAEILERLDDEELANQPPGKLAASLSMASAGLGIPVVRSGRALHPVEQLRADVEAGVRRVADDAGGVVLGRAAAVVLAGVPGAFHVRLAGPSSRRLDQGMVIEGASRELAAAHQVAADRVRSQFVRRLFGRDPADADLYHLVVDSTAVPLDACVELVVAAASAFWDRERSAPGD